MYYFDNAATTFPKPEKVYLSMDKANRQLAVNAGRGSYTLAKEATKLIDRTKEQLLSLVNGNQEADVVLTPSATIALNEIIGGMEWSGEDVVYVSAFEHNAVMRTLHMMQKKYEFKIIELPIKENTLSIDEDRVEFMFAKDAPTRLFMTHISNVTGYILPIERLTKMAKEYSCEVVIDASQSLGLLEIDMRKLDADYIVFAGHKNLYGPFGVGGFFIRSGKSLSPYIAGGTGSDSLNLDMPENSVAKFEPASPNVVAMAGLSSALKVIEEYDGDFYEDEKQLTDTLVDKLKKIYEVTLYLPPAEEHVGIISFNIQGYKASEIGMILDEDYGIAVRTGYHCAPLIHEHLKDKSYSGVVRASIGRYTTMEEVERFVEAVKEVAEG